MYNVNDDGKEQDEDVDYKKEENVDNSNEERENTDDDDVIGAVDQAD